MSRTIEVIPYDYQWSKLFEKESAHIKQALGENCVEIHHIGSTAVPGLCAKPKIDMIAVVKERAFNRQALEELGYQYKGEFNIPFRLGFSKRSHHLNVNLHAFEEGNPEIELNLLFRDYLRTHEDAREAYGALKLKLVSQKALHEKKDAIFSGYNLGKDAFIKNVLEQAGFKGVCMRVCTHYDEWEVARHFRQKYFFDKVSVADPYTWTFGHKDHVHLVLYEGTRIVGYAHIQLWADHRAALRIIVIEETLRNKGRGGRFLELCERWLKQQGFTLLQIRASPHAYSFYCQHGYTKMSFNAPDGYEGDLQDIEMGKKL
jgi:GrpB-like predicted nucleotidyltransferase (UPF0157 family)/predicted GNAT family N-acyltransferase